MGKETKKLKIGIYSPYLRIFGGGERYLLTIAAMLSCKHEVFVFFEESIKEKAKSIFDIYLNRVHFLPEKIFRTKNLFNKYISLLDFDIFFYMTDGSLFFPVVKKNFLIIQSPSHIPRLSLINRLKLLRWDVLCYSKFMEKIISKRLNKKAKIVPPCINMNRFRSNFEAKENIILTVGRFFPYPHNKKHNFLITAFKKNYEKHFKGWRLIIAGGLTEKGGEGIVYNLRKDSAGFPIEILVNLPFAKLLALYQKTKLYWHAVGFGEDIAIHPERAEHFGITTLEAMAAGVVPVIFEAGGQKDIVIDGESGYFWHTEEELVQKTHFLVSNISLVRVLSRQAELRSRDFSCQKFYGELEKKISG